MENAVVIRRTHLANSFSPDDYPVVVRLLEQLSPGKEHQFDWRALNDLLHTGNELLVARSMADGGNTIVGLTILARVAKATRWHGEIHDVVVDERFRGQGLGKSLLLRAIELAREDQRLEFLELTSKPSREAANQLYVSLGFTLVSVPNPALPEGQGTNLYRLKIR